MWAEMAQEKKTTIPTLIRQLTYKIAEGVNVNRTPREKCPTYKEITGRTYVSVNLLRRLKATRTRKALTATQSSCSTVLCIWFTRLPVRAATAVAIWRSTRAAPTSQCLVVSTTMGTKETPCEAQVCAIYRWVSFCRVYASAAAPALLLAKARVSCRWCAAMAKLSAAGPPANAGRKTSAGWRGADWMSTGDWGSRSPGRSFSGLKPTFSAHAWTISRTA